MYLDFLGPTLYKSSLKTQSNMSTFQKSVSFIDNKKDVAQDYTENVPLSAKGGTVFCGIYLIASPKKAYTKTSL